MEQKITLEQAYAVINADRDAERARKRMTALAYVGRFFKFDNCFSSDERWWKYAAVTSVDDYGHKYGWGFEHDSNDCVRVYLKELHSGLPNGWVEITAETFAREASKTWQALSKPLESLSGLTASDVHNDLEKTNP